MSRPLEELRGLGPTTARRLRAAGIDDEDALWEIGPEKAYVRMTEHGHATENLLWALFGALHDLDWREIPPHEKDRLREEVARLRAPGFGP